MSIWDDIPDAIEVDLDQLPDDKKQQLLTEYLDEAKAANLVMMIDGSAADYEQNIQRVTQILDIVNIALNGAVRIVKLA